MREVDWKSVVVCGDIEDGFYAQEGCYTDGTELTDAELDALDAAMLYDIGYDDAVAAAEYAFEGDR